jgi:hypothetical protein
MAAPILNYLNHSKEQITQAQLERIIELRQQISALQSELIIAENDVLLALACLRPVQEGRLRAGIDYIERTWSCSRTRNRLVISRVLP